MLLSNTARSLLIAASLGALISACASAAQPPSTTEVTPVQAAQPGDSSGAQTATPGAQTAAPGAQTASPVPRLLPSDYRIVSPNPNPPSPPLPGPGGPDKDADGIADVSDQCVDVPEDRDGFQDLDGCPDPDNDMDGIADMNDRCPDAPETKNGKQDDDGCPD